jgi:hypothetical protein
VLPASEYKEHELLTLRMRCRDNPAVGGRIVRIQKAWRGHAKRKELEADGTMKVRGENMPTDRHVHGQRHALGQTCPRTDKTTDRQDYGHRHAVGQTGPQTDRTLDGQCLGQTELRHCVP